MRAFLGIRSKITGQASEVFWCDTRRGWVRRTFSSTQTQTRRSSRAKKTVGLTSLFFPNVLEAVFIDGNDELTAKAAFSRY